MSMETPTAHQSAVTMEHSFSETLETYTSLVNSLLADSDVTDDDDMATLKGLSSHLIDEATDIETRVEDNEEAVSETRELVADTRREQADVRSDVHEVKQAVESDDGDDVQPDVGGSTPTPDGEQTGTHDPQTALGDCVSLPEPVADQELSANVKRARDVAANVIDYARSVPAGYSITSSKLRTVLTALKESGGQTYTETVSRVIDYLDDLGQECVKVKTTMGGERTVVFSDEFVKRTVAWRNQSSDNAVVTGETVGG